MNWYTEIELYHGTSEWDILREGFLLMFMFEDWWWDIIDDALHVVKTIIFNIPQEPIEALQLEWVTELSYALD